jgi:hypothetical protein
VTEFFVAQISNLLYRRFVIGRVLASSSLLGRADAGRIQFCETAEFSSALRGDAFCRAPVAGNAPERALDLNDDAGQSSSHWDWPAQEIALDSTLAP